MLNYLNEPGKLSEGSGSRSREEGLCHNYKIGRRSRTGIVFHIPTHIGNRLILCDFTKLNETNSYASTLRVDSNQILQRICIMH